MYLTVLHSFDAWTVDLVIGWIPQCKQMSSLLDSWTIELKGICSLFDWPYPPRFEWCGRSSHLLRRCLLTTCSTFPTVPISISLIISGHTSLNRRQCWKIQALNFPKRSYFSIHLSPSQTGDVASLCCSCLSVRNQTTSQDIWRGCWLEVEYNHLRCLT